jgi:hypothetical protein
VIGGRAGRRRLAKRPSRRRTVVSGGDWPKSISWSQHQRKLAHELNVDIAGAIDPLVQVRDAASISRPSRRIASRVPIRPAHSLSPFLGSGRIASNTAVSFVNGNLSMLLKSIVGNGTRLSGEMIRARQIPIAAIRRFGFMP